MRALLVATLVAAGCGSPLVPADVVRAPIFSVSGTTTADTAPMGTLRVAALWVDPLGQLDDRPWPPEGVAPRAGTTDTFDLVFSAAPPPEIIRRIPSMTDPNVTVTAFAFAEIVAFDDVDGDGTFRVGPLAAGAAMIAPDVYRGSAGAQALFYVAEPDQQSAIPELASVLDGAVGYHLAEVSCNATTLGGQFNRAPAGDQFSIGLGAAQADLPERRTCLRSHAPPPAQ